MTRKEIICEIGKLEDKLERQPELEDEINQQIRELGKKLESMEIPSKFAPKTKVKRTYKKPPFTKSELKKLAKKYTNREIGDMFDIEMNYVAVYKCKWKIKGKNEKPGRKKGA